jgi:hypothetical protein
MKQQSKKHLSLSIISFSNTFRKWMRFWLIMLLIVVIMFVMSCSLFGFDKICCNISIVLLLITSVIVAIYPAIYKEIHISGNITFKPQLVIIDNKQFNIKSISRIEFFYKSLKGDNDIGALFGFGIIGSDHGGDNTIEISTGNSVIKYNILILDYSQVTLLRAFLEYYKSKDIETKFIDK